VFTPADRNRIVVVWVRPEVVMDLLHGWRRHLRPGPGGRSVGVVALPSLEAGRLADGSRLEIPADCEVLDVCHDFRQRAFGVVLSHPSFPAVADGDYAPSVSLTECTVHGLAAEQTSADAPIEVEAPPPT
jgi:hypothetical protein